MDNQFSLKDIKFIDRLFKDLSTKFGKLIKEIPKEIIENHEPEIESFKKLLTYESFELEVASKIQTLLSFNKFTFTQFFETVTKECYYYLDMSMKKISNRMREIDEEYFHIRQEEINHPTFDSNQRNEDEKTSLEMNSNYLLTSNQRLEEGSAVREEMPENQLSSIENNSSQADKASKFSKVQSFLESKNIETVVINKEKYALNKSDVMTNQSKIKDLIEQSLSECTKAGPKRDFAPVTAEELECKKKLYIEQSNKNKALTEKINELRIKKGNKNEEMEMPNKDSANQSLLYLVASITFVLLFIAFIKYLKWHSATSNM